MSPLPTPVNCPNPRLVKLVQFRAEHVIYTPCILWGTHDVIPEQ